MRFLFALRKSFRVLESTQMLGHTLSYRYYRSTTVLPPPRIFKTTEKDKNATHSSNILDGPLLVSLQSLSHQPPIVYFVCLKDDNCDDINITTTTVTTTGPSDSDYGSICLIDAQIHIPRTGLWRWSQHGNGCQTQTETIP